MRLPAGTGCLVVGAAAPIGVGPLPNGVMASNPEPPSGRLGQALAGWTGLAAHFVAAGLRRIMRAHTVADPANVAVICSAFVRYACDQAIGLQQTGSCVTLYYVDRLAGFADNEGDRELFLERVRASGVELVRLPRLSLRSLLQETLWLHRDLRRRKIAAAVVQSHHDPRFTTLGLGVPVALMLHDPQTHTGDSLSTFAAPIRSIARISELTSSCLIVHSPRLFDQLRPLLRRLPIGVVPHGADMAAMPTAMPAERTLLIFGRLFEYKGVDTALEAFGRLSHDLSDAILVVAGNGPLAVAARDQRNVEVHEGYIAEERVGELLDRARLVLLPYKDSTQSGVGLQAVARGVPCIVSHTGGLPELVQDASAGLVVPPNDPERLAEAILAYVDHGHELRQSIYDRAAANFAWPVVAQRLRAEMSRLDVGD